MVPHELVLPGRKYVCVPRGSERKRTKHSIAGVEVTPPPPGSSLALQAKT